MLAGTLFHMQFFQHGAISECLGTGCHSDTSGRAFFGDVLRAAELKSAVTR